MTFFYTNNRVLKCKLLNATALFLALQAPIIASAETQVKLQSFSDQKRITEGYNASVEEWSVDAEYETPRHILFTDDDAHQADVWVHDVGTSLYADYDHDGYFGGFSLSFDVDTAYGDRDIYAVIYLQLSYQPPVELHTTEVFTIYSTSSSDSYRIDAELVDNYRAGEYQVQIDIHDARYGDVLDSVDHESFRNLRNLPLEAEPYHDATTAVIVTEFAGFGGPVLLAMLALVALLRRGRDGSGILATIPKADRAKPLDNHYEPVSNTASTINRIPI